VTGPTAAVSDARIYGASSPALPANSAQGLNREVGLRFIPAGAVYLVAVRWYRALTAQAVPGSVRLWDTTSTATPIWTLVAPAGWSDTPSVVGWKEQRLAAGTQPLLVAGREYVLSYSVGGGVSNNDGFSNYTPVGDTGITFTTHVSISGAGNYPTTTGTMAFGVDGAFRATISAPTPAQSGALRLPNEAAGAVAWRNGTDGADLLLYPSAADVLVFGAAGSTVPLLSQALADAKGDLFAGSGADAVGRLAVGSNGQLLVADSAQALGVKWASQLVPVSLVIDGGGSVLATGSKGFLEVPLGSAGTIVAARLVAAQAGSIQVTIKKATFAGLPTTTSIVASAPLVLSSAQKSENTTLSGWTTAIADGDWLELVVDSVTTITRVTVSLSVRRS
jgi:hypothetical protein